MKWMVCAFDGSESGLLRLNAGDLVIHLRSDCWGVGQLEVPDFWEMAKPSELLITSRGDEVPAGISPTKPSADDLVGDLPNVWRVREGGRVALVGERPQGRIYLLFDFHESALVHWRYGKDDLPLPMQAMQDTAPSGSAENMEWMRLAVSKVASMQVHCVPNGEWHLRPARFKR